MRQGENLSPLLFALFLNVLDTFFTKQKWDTLDYIDKLYSDCNNNVSTVFCPGFQKGRVPSEKGIFSAVNGPSKGHH